MFLTGAILTEVLDAPKFPLGTNFRDQTGRQFKYVQYVVASGAVAAVAGNVCYYYAPGGVSAGAVAVVTSDLSDSAEVGAGVLQSAPTNNQYCWIQTKGPATLNTALTAGGDGDPLTPTGSTDGTLDLATAITDHICATAIDASAKIVTCNFPD